MAFTETEEYFYRQGTDELSGQRGYFIYISRFPHCAVSPIYNLAIDLFNWMKGTFEICGTGPNGNLPYSPTRLRYIPAKERHGKSLTINPQGSFEYKLYPPSRVNFYPSAKVYDLTPTYKEKEDKLKIKGDDEFIEFVVKK